MSFGDSRASAAEALNSVFSACLPRLEEHAMPPVLVIRRKVTREGGYTVFMLPGYCREWRTSEREHREILKLFKQDRPHEDVVNDFTEYRLGED